MINLLDFGELINYTEFIYDRELNCLKRIKYQDANDNICIVTDKNNGKYISHVFLEDNPSPIVISTSSFDYNRIKNLANSSNDSPPKIFKLDPYSKEALDVVVNEHITLKIPNCCKAIQEGNITTISSVIDMDKREDKYLVDDIGNVFYKLQQTDDCMGAVVKFSKDIEARKTNTASALVREIPYLYDIYNAIYLTDTNTNSVESIFIESDEYGIVKDFTDDPTHAGAYRMRHARKNNTKGIMYERDDREIKSIHPLFVDPVDISKIYDGCYYVIETLSPKNVYRRTTVRINDVYNIIHLKKDMSNQYSHIESIIL